MPRINQGFMIRERERKKICVKLIFEKKREIKEVKSFLFNQQVMVTGKNT